MSEKYNGWTNYETWACSLWYVDFWNETMRDRAADQDYQVMSESDIASMLESDIDELENVPSTGLLADIAGAALSRIDWYDLAKSVYETQNETVSENISGYYADQSFIEQWLDENDFDGMTLKEIANAIDFEYDDEEE